MEKNIINLQSRRVEKKLVPISAKVANAVSLLAEVQLELEELYISLDERAEEEQEDEKRD